MHTDTGPFHGPRAQPHPQAPFLTVVTIARGDEPGLAGFCRAVSAAGSDSHVLYCTHKTPSFRPEERATHIYGYWDDDFSAARNRAQFQAAGHWLMWLDTDEAPPDLQQVKGFLATVPGDAVSMPLQYSDQEFLTSIRCYRGDYWWRGVVHEALVNTLSSTDTPTFLDMMVYHRGKNDLEKRVALRRNHRIAQKRYLTSGDSLEKSLCALWMADYEVVTDSGIDQAHKHYLEAHDGAAHRPDAALGLFRIALHRKKYWEALYWARKAGRGLAAIPLMLLGYHDRAGQVALQALTATEPVRIRNLWWEAAVLASGAAADPKLAPAYDQHVSMKLKGDPQIRALRLGRAVL